MKVYGIVAEYNPFHNGHLYQIQQIKEKDKAAFIVVILSGYFCQRGEPALVSLSARVKMALSCGANLVLLLPTYAALGSAELFASAAVSSLDQTGICHYLAFGAENDCIADLKKLAKLLVDEEKPMWNHMEALLKSGLSYPEARQSFVQERLGDEIAKLLAEPNQILAIEYLKAIKKNKLRLEPYLIKRQGAHFLDQNLPLNKESKHPSASAIRHFLSDKKDSFLTSSDIQKLKTFMPAKALAILCAEWQKGAFVKSDKLNSLYMLSLENAENPETRYLDQDLFNRLKKILRFSDENYPSIEDLVSLAKTKPYPTTRVQRALTNLVLNIKEVENFQVEYLHVLGFNKDGRYLLKKMRAQAKLPVITNFSDLRKVLDETNLWQENLEIRASRFWLEMADQPINQVFDSPLIIR